MGRIECLARTAAIAILPALISVSEACADDFTASKVMSEMSVDQRSGYIAGVVEGLAIARYNKDGKQRSGMECIYDWYYDDKQTLPAIYAAFDKYPTYPPGSIIDVMSKQKCGE